MKRVLTNQNRSNNFGGWMMPFLFTLTLMLGSMAGYSQCTTTIATPPGNAYTGISQYAQSFQAACTGNLSTYFFQGSPNPDHIEVRAGIGPTGPLLYSSTINTFNPHHHNFESAVPVTSGQYFTILNCFDNTNVAHNPIGANPIYPNGSLWVYQISTQSWVEKPNDDNYCTLTITPPCNAPTVPTLTTTSSTICYGDNPTLSIASGTLNSATSWNWYTGGCGTIYAGTGTSINVSPAVTTTYYARGEGGCVTPGNCGSITITVNSTPATTPTIASSFNPICNTDQPTLFITSGSLNNATNWYWYAGGCGTTIVGSGTSINVNPNSTTTYYARGEGSCVTPGNCGSTTITVNPIPNGSISANGPFCNSGTGQLTWTANISTGPYTIVYNDGVANRTATGVTSGVPFNVFGNPITSTKTYTLVSITDGNCLRTNGFSNNTATVIVNTIACQNGGTVNQNCGCNCPTGFTGTNCQTSTCIAPTIPTLNASSSTNCGTQATTLSLATGILNSATSWKWYSGTCGGTLVGTGTSISVSPTGTTTYYVRGEGGCITPGVCGSITITVNPIPTVVITANPSSGAICIGSSITMNASGASTYSWTGGVTNNVAISPTTTSIYIVTGTTNGCTKTATQTVTVNPLPTITVNPIPTSATICLGGSVTLAGSGATTYSWSNGVTNNTAFSPTATTTYTVTGTNTTTGCSNTTTQIVTMNPLPVISSTVIPSSATVCAGGSVTLNGSGAINYSWSGGVLNNTSFIPTATTTYTVTGTNNNGCSNTATRTVTVNPLPIIGNTVSPTSGVICFGGQVTLNGSGPVGTTYVWTNNSPNGIAFSPITPTYTVTGTDPNGCTNVSTRTLTTNVRPTISITSSAINSSICIGNSITLTATGGTSYSWNNGITNTIAFSPTAYTTYTVTVTDGNNCTNTSFQIVNVYPLPTITSTASTANGNVCIGSSIILYGSGSSGYTWSGGISNGVAFSPTATTTYTVTGTNIYNCVGTSTRTVVVNPLPTIGSAVIPSTGTVCAGGQVTLNGTGGTSYAWSGGRSDNAPFIPSSTAIYSVTGTDANGCTNTSTRTVTVNPLPTVTVNATPSNAIVCAGGSITLSGSGANTYSWNNGVSNAVAFSPTASTTYIVTGTNTTTGCTNTASQSVLVIPLPNVGLTVSPLNATVCSGSPVTLTGTGATSYSWNPTITNNFAFNPTTTTTYTVTGTTNGCTKTASQTVTVNALPNVSSNATPSTTVCAGSQVTLNGTGAITYSWSNGVTNSAVFSIIATTTYTVTGTNTTTGCNNTATQIITVNPLPVVSYTTIPLSATVCAGASVSLSGGGASSYTWSGGISNGVFFIPTATTTYIVTGTDGNNCSNTASKTVTVNPLPIVGITTSPSATTCTGVYEILNGTGANSYSWSGGISNNVSFIPTASTSYSVTGTDGNGCTKSASQTITLLPLPTVSSTVSPSASVCSGTSVTLNGNGANSYSWSGGISNAVAFIVNNTATYTVTGTGTNGCTNTAMQTVTVLPLPTIGASASPGTTVCAGTSVTLNGSGGYSYSWSGGASNNVAFIPTATTTYIVTGTGTNGCTNIASITIIVNPLPTITSIASPSTALCIGASVILSGSGGINLTWTGGVTNGQSFIPTMTTTYIVTGAGSNGCTNTSSRTITINPLPVITSTATQSATICPGGSVTLNGAGGTSYSWSNGATNGVAFSPSATTTYTVTGYDGNGCINTSTKTITVNPLPTVIANASPSALVCIGTSVTLTGSGAISYSWNNGVTNNAGFIPTATTTYSVTGTDGNGCVNTSTKTITVNSLPILNASVLPSATFCLGNSVTLTGSGASTYSWSNGASNGVSFTPTATTIYKLTGTDGNGCTNTITRTITVNPLPTIGSNANPSTTLCAGSSITLNGTGANTYVWSNGVSNNVAFSLNATTTYSVTGTDHNGCTGTSTRTVTVNQVQTLSTTASPSSAVCMGSSVTLTGSNFSTYSWSGGITNGVSFSPTTATTYTVTATAGNGCTRTGSVSIAINSLPTAWITNNSGSTVLTCTSPSISVTATGGASYLWNNATTNPVRSITSGGLSTVTVTGSNGCTANASINVTSNQNPPTASITNNSGTTIITCSQTSISITATGGGTYIWDNSTTNDNRTVTSTGSYRVTVTSANGCTTTSSISITSSTTAPTAGIINYSGTSIITCSTPSISLSGTGGNSYLWNNGSTNMVLSVTTSGNYTVTVTGINGCTASSSYTTTSNTTPPNISITNNSGTSILTCTTSTINVTLNGSGVTYLWDNGTGNANRILLQVGTYSVTTTSSTNGCTTSASVAITSNFTSPTISIINNTGSTTISCTNTSISLSGSGGMVYLWDNGSTNVNRIVTSVGTYTVIATGSNGCTASASMTITTNTSAPTAGITNNTGASTLTCNTPTISLTATGGSTYLWNNGSTDANRSVGTAGTHSVTVTGSNGCTATASIVITGNTTLTTTAITNNTGSNTINCITQSISLTATGGVSYLWFNGSTDSNKFVSSAGTYSVTVTGSNGCTATASAIITNDVTPPTVGITNNSGTNIISCNQIYISLTATGGVSYIWSNASTNQNQSMTNPGLYIATAYGRNGCSASTSITLTGNSLAPNGSITNNSGTSVITCGTPNISLTATDGVSYNWDNGSTNANRSVTSAGTYLVTITGSNACTVLSTIDITSNNAAPTASVTNNTGTNVLNCVTTSINLTATGGVNYIWSNGSTNVNISITTAGLYLVTVTGSNGCTSQSGFFATSNTTPPTAAITNNTGTNVLNCNTASINLTATGGNFYHWDNNNNNPNRTVTSQGNYIVTVTANNGCTTTTSILIGQNLNIPNVSITNFSSTAILTCTTNYITLNAGGGNSYHWNNGSPSSLINVFSPGTYIVTTTNNNSGCTASASITITQNITPPTISITNNTGTYNIDCNTNSISLTATGANSYSWSDNTTNATDVFTVPGGYSVYGQSNSNGCYGVANFTITVSNNHPSIQSVSASSSTICNGDFSNLTVSGDLNDASDWHWYSGSCGGIDEGYGSTITVFPTTTTTYYVKGEGGCDCNSITLIVNSTPDQPIITGPSDICGSGGFRVYSIAPVSGATDYTWTVPADWTILSGAHTTSIFVLIGSLSGDVTVSASAFCGISILGVKTVTINTIYPTPVTSTNAPLCEGNTLALFGTNVAVGQSTDNYYSWTGPDNFSSSDQNPSIANVTTNAAGTYYLTLTHGACSSTTSVDVIINTNPTLSITSHTDVTCNGLNNGSVTISATGGQNPYLITDGNSVNTNGIFSNYAPGTYFFTVTDNNGCDNSHQGNISATISEPSILTATATVNGPIVCHGGTTTITVSGNGGTTPYSNSGTFIVGPGVFGYTITDAHGCTAATSVNTISNPQTMTSSISSPTFGGGYNVSCRNGTNGSINLIINGGVTGYSYLWSNGSTAQNPTGLAATPYSVIVTDANGCTLVTSKTLTQPAALTPTISVGTAIACNGGTTSITVGATGGVSGYTGTGINTVSAGITYSYTVTDANGCNATATRTITQPTVNSFTTVVSNVTGCGTASNGFISITTSGGTGAKVFSKDNGATYSSANPMTGLAIGTYTVLVKDANNCTSSPTVIVIGTNAGVTFTTVVVNATSCTSSTGKITITASGGSGYYQYSKDGGTTWGGTYIFSNLLHGTYSMKVKDIQGCMSTVSVVTVGPSCREENSSIATTMQPNTLHIYPNPASEHVTVSFEANQEANYTLRLTDVLGRVVMKQSGISAIGNNQVELRIANFAKGVYSIILESGDETRKSRLVLQ